MCLGVWVRSRRNPDGGLSVVQLYRGFVLGSFLSDDHYVLGFNVNLQTRVWLVGPWVVPGYV